MIDFEEVEWFVVEINCDVFVVVIGISYGVYKFICELDGDVLVMDCIEEIYKCLFNCYLVMYGSFLVFKEF